MGAKMQPQEPISVFQNPAPTAKTKSILHWSNATRGLRMAYGCLAFSTSMLIVVIAADIASAG
jgi:hypothetical protein